MGNLNIIKESSTNPDPERRPRKERSRKTPSVIESRASPVELRPKKEGSRNTSSSNEGSISPVELKSRKKPSYYEEG